MSRRFRRPRIPLIPTPIATTIAIVFAFLVALAVIRSSPTLTARANAYVALAIEISGYVRGFLTDPRFVANMPMRYALLGIAEGIPDERTRDARLRVPEGFVLGVYAEAIPHPRMLRFTPAGDLLVSQPRTGRVLLLSDDDHDGRSDGSRVVLEGLELPHGLEIHDGWLYVAELEAIRRWRLDAKGRAVVGAPERIATLERASSHNLRTVRIGPDGWLYVSVGVDCNHCEPKSAREGTILRFQPGSGREEVVASGLRNVVGFDWRPADGALYANDIGSDFLGEDFPPEEMNRIEHGGFYGFPYAHGGGIPDPELGDGQAARIHTSLGPAHVFPPHSTPLGMTFLRGASIPARYRGAALVALHGSWNRTRKSGYQVVAVHWDAGGRIQQSDFLTGFELDEDVIGRPVDIVEGPDGAIYLSDDYAGAIYRIAPI